MTEMPPKADTIVNQSTNEVERLLAQANQEVANWVAAATAEGSKLGAEQAEQLRTKLAALRELMLKEIDADIVRAAFETAKDILHAEVSRSKVGIIQIIQTALKAVPEIAQASLRVNPLDAPLVRTHKQAIIDAMDRAKDVDVREDKLVERGGVLIHTETGVIDAQLSTQLDEIARVLGV